MDDMMCVASVLRYLWSQRVPGISHNTTDPAYPGETIRMPFS